MTDISRLLAVALQAAASPGEAVGPVELAAEVARQWDKPADNDRAAVRAVARAALAEALGQVMRSAQMSAASGEPPPDRLVALFRWLHVTLSNWSEKSDLGKGQLAAALIVVASLGSAVEDLIRTCPAINANAVLLTELATSISELRADYDLDAPGMPCWEREFAERFIAAEATRDWIHLAEAWPRLEVTSRPSPELSATVLLLASADPLRLAEALRDIMQTTVAMQVMAVLTAKRRLAVAVRSKNPVVIFAALHQSLRNRSGAELPKEICAAVTDILHRAAGDIGLWRGWMSAFGKYPPNYASLHLSLGHALALAPVEAIAAYVETLALSPRTTPSDPSRMAVAACLRAFRERADAPRRKKLWLLAFQRWSVWRFDAADRNANLTELRWSDLDYAVYHFALECISEAELRAKETVILVSLSTIVDRWHTSPSHATTEWFRLLSELQPYANAQAVNAGHHDSDDIAHAYMPASIEGNRYFELMFGQAMRSDIPM